MEIKDESNDEIKLISFESQLENNNLKTEYLGWLNNPEITRLIASPSLDKKNKKIDFIEDSFQRFTKEDCMGFFIFHDVEKKFLGTAKIDNICLNKKSAWDGIMIGDKAFHGKGIATKVYKIILAFAFLELKLHRINSGCNSKNIGMIKTFEKIGYKKEGCLREADFIDGNFSDHLYFGILNHEFFKKNEVNLKVNN